MYDLKHTLQLIRDFKSPVELFDSQNRYLGARGIGTL